MVGTDGNTPIRNKKVGLPDPQGNGGQPSIATTEPSAMVQQMAAQNFALKNGGQAPPMQGNGTGTPPPVATMPPMNVFAGGNRIIGKYDVPVNPQPQQNPNGAPVTDFTNMPSTPQFAPQTAGNANPTMGPVSTPYMKDAADTTPQNVTNFEQMPIQKQPTGWNLDGTAQYDSLSAALNDTTQQPQQAQFQADPTQKDGGFFNWIKGLIPKKRPGKREGETDDEYDARRTRNMQMIATLADAIRHMGNIVNTSKGAPLQQFNDPSTMLETGYQNRKAQRQKQDALDRDAAQKQNEMTLKQQAAEADRNYKALTLNLKQQAADRAADKDKFDREYKAAGLKRQLDNDAFSHDLAGKKFDEQKRHNGVAEQQGAARIALSQERNGIARTRLANSIANGGGSGGGGKGSSTVNLSSPAGHLNRKKELSTVEKKQITQYLIKNGYINKKNLDAYNNYVTMGDTKNVGNLQNYWIAYAANMPGKKGDTFRTTLKNHYMYKETTTTSTQSATTKNGGGSGGGKSGKSGQNGKTGNKGKSGKGWASGFKI